MTQKVVSQCLGIVPTFIGTSTLQLNSANTWLAMGFVPSDNKQVTKIRLFVSSVTASPNTPVAADYKCEIYNNNAGNPGVSIGVLASPASVPASGGSGIVEFTGAVNVSKGVQYWAVFKNNNAAPATVNMTYRTGGTNSLPIAISDGNVRGWGRRSSTDGGTTWPTIIGSCFGLRVDYNDGTSEGLPIVNASSVSSGSYIYSNREIGTRFVIPSNVRLNIIGLQAYIAKSGSPTGCRLGLWLGDSPTLLGYATLPIADITTTSIAPFTALFTSPIIVESGSIIRATIADSAGNLDIAANSLKTSFLQIDNDAISKALMPLTARGTFFDGAAWDSPDVSVNLIPFNLILQTGGEFAPQAGGIFILNE